MSRSARLKVAVFALLLLAALAAARSGVLPSVTEMREAVSSLGRLGPLVFVLGYALLVLVPSPKGVLTAAGGALFGLWGGAALALTGAVIGSLAAFEIGRLLGRDAVVRMTGGRFARVERVLGEHGLAAVFAVRLAPVVPFTLINYGSGVAGVTRRDFLLGTTLGMIPGAVAYSAVGAYGADPLYLGLAVAGLLLLAVGGGLWGRRILARPGRQPTSQPVAAERAAAPVEPLPPTVG